MVVWYFANELISHMDKNAIVNRWVTKGPHLDICSNAKLLGPHLDICSNRQTLYCPQDSAQKSEW